MMHKQPPSEEVLKTFNKWLELERDLNQQRHEREMKKLKVREKEASVKTKLVPYFSKSDKIFVILMIILIFTFSIGSVLLM